MRDSYSKIRCCNVDGRRAFRSDDILYFFDENNLWSRECARLAAECHSGTTPTFLIEEIDNLGDGQFRHRENGEIYTYPRGDGTRRRVALDLAKLRETKRSNQQTASENTLGNFSI